MNTTIYYFSATGNSLHLAKQLAKKLNTQELVSISEVSEQDVIHCSSERIGIICPVFAWGPPRIVMEFLNKLQVKGNPYMFAIASCVGIPAKTLVAMQDALERKNVTLNAGFVVKSSCSSLAKKNALDHIVIGLDRKRKHLKTGDERLQEMISVIENLETRKPESSSWLANRLGTFFHAYGVDFFKTASQDFKVSEKCSGCGTCVRVCPRANITLSYGNPHFYDDCEFCHACIQWCPEFAITHPNFDGNLKQYRNPNIQLADLLVNA
jgi:ferredoxin